MHEYSIVQALLESVEEQSRAHGAVTVHRLRVRVGELSGVDPQLLTSAYLVFRERTICAAADLIIDRVPAFWACPDCEHAIEAGRPLRCSTCGAPAKLRGGDELVLDRIEMEVP